jgi:hypothetical protein
MASGDHGRGRAGVIEALGVGQQSLEVSTPVNG